MERLLIKNIRYLYCMDEEDTFLENADIYDRRKCDQKNRDEAGCAC